MALLRSIVDMLGITLIKLAMLIVVDTGQMALSVGTIGAASASGAGVGIIDCALDCKNSDYAWNYGASLSVIMLVVRVMILKLELRLVICTTRIRFCSGDMALRCRSMWL